MVPFSVIQELQAGFEIVPITDRMPQMAQSPPGYSDARVSGSWWSADFQKALSTFLSFYSCLDGLVTGPVPLHRCISSFMLPVWQIMALRPRPCITVKPLAQPFSARERVVTLFY